MNEKFVAALHWILDFLEDQQFDYVISGGVAAYIYGSRTREIADIDIDVNVAPGLLLMLHGMLHRYAVQEPVHYLDAHWNATILTLQFDGQEIDLTNHHTAKIFNRHSGQWEAPYGFKTDRTVVEFCGRKINVIEKSALVNYKNKLGREVDLTDVMNILQQEVA